jgi:hypothetical protein
MSALTICASGKDPLSYQKLRKPCIIVYMNFEQIIRYIPIYNRRLELIKVSVE